MVPSWYGAVTNHGAFFETVFRDVVGRRDRVVQRSVAMAGRVVSRVRLESPLQLLNLYGDGLVSLGLTTSFMSLEPRSYRHTIRIAALLYAGVPTIHGFIWLSRINNSEKSIVIYEPRMTTPFGSALETYPIDSGRGELEVGLAAYRINCAIL
jgi:RES domain-containing protein